jgi:hypothetical protein
MNSNDLLLSNIILDIKYKIASFNSLAWYKLYLYDDEFNKYARTNTAIKEFILLFSKEEIIHIAGGYFRTQMSILGIIHSFNDGPAIEYMNKKVWYYAGLIHRDDDKPAIVRKNDNGYSNSWYKNGKMHRDDDKPALICSGGCSHYFKDDEEYVPTI